MGKNRPGHHKSLPARIKLPLSIIVLGGIVLWVLVQWFKPGLPFTHDGQIHLVRMAQYYLSLKDDQLPPRWAGPLNNNFGYPVFNFNYPLPNILAYPLIKTHLTVVTVFKIEALAAILLGCIGILLWLAVFAGPVSGLIGALFYGLNPYSLELLFVRGSMGELWSLALFPWLFYFATKLIKNRGSIPLNTLGLMITGGAFVISHNVMVMFGFPVFLGYSGWLGRADLKQVVKRIGLPIIIILLLGAFFWLPAIFEKKATILDQATVTNGYADHFVTIKQLLVSPWGYGFSNSGPVDGLSFALGIAQLAVVYLSIIVALKFRDKKLGFLLVILAGLGWLMLSSSRLIWQNLPLLYYIQFPWRLLFLVQFFLAIMAAYLYTLTREWRWLWGILLLVLIVQAKTIAQPIDRINPTNQDLFYATETTSTLDENMPRWFDKTVDFTLKENLFRDKLAVGEQPDTEVKILKWTGSDHIYTVTAVNPDRIVERSAYFPGWEVTLNGQPVPIDYQMKKYPGLITFALEPGNYQVRTRFTQNTWPRKIGNLLTLIGLVALVGYPLWLSRFLSYKIKP